MAEHDKSQPPEQASGKRIDEDRREHKRVPIKGILKVDVHGENVFITGIANNISEGGIFVEMRDPAVVSKYAVGDREELRFTFPGYGGVVTTIGEVRHTVLFPTETSRIGVGFKFVNLPDEVAQCLKNYLKDKQVLYMPIDDDDL